MHAEEEKYVCAHTRKHKRRGVFYLLPVTVRDSCHNSSGGAIVTRHTCGTTSTTNGSSRGGGRGLCDTSGCIEQTRKRAAALRRLLLQEELRGEFALVGNEVVEEPLLVRFLQNVLLHEAEKVSACGVNSLR